MLIVVFPSRLTALVAEKRARLFVPPILPLSEMIPVPELRISDWVPAALVESMVLPNVMAPLDAAVEIVVTPGAPVVEPLKFNWTAGFNTTDDAVIPIGAAAERVNGAPVVTVSAPRGVVAPILPPKLAVPDAPLDVSVRGSPPSIVVLKLIGPFDPAAMTTGAVKSTVPIILTGADAPLDVMLPLSVMALEAADAVYETPVAPLTETVEL